MRHRLTSGRPIVPPGGPSRGSARRLIRYRTVAAFLADYEANLSRGAAFLNTRRSLKVGTVLRLEISLRRPSLRAGLEGRVAHVRPFGNDTNEAPGMRVELFGGDRLRSLTLLAESLRAGLPTLVPQR